MAIGCCLLLWHGLLLLLWPWLLLQLLHCSLLQCYCLLLQCSLLLAQRSLLLLPLAKCFNQMTENFWLHWPSLHWLLLLLSRWDWRCLWLWLLPRHGAVGGGCCPAMDAVATATAPVGFCGAVYKPRRSASGTGGARFFMGTHFGCWPTGCSSAAAGHTSIATGCTLTLGPHCLHPQPSGQWHC